VNALHRHLLQDSADAARLVPNDPLSGMVNGVAAAIAAYGHADACCLMVIQPGERNIFDQRLLEFGLRERGIATVRMALAEIPGNTRLHEGHLLVEGRPAAVTYLRAGYGPEDYTSAEAWQGRERIEASSTIAVPDVLQQLAGAKMVQQRLTAPDVLQRFCPPGEHAALAATFVGQFALDDPIGDAGGTAPAWQVARDTPARFVLKPQREGGGNNLYDAELAARLTSLSPTQRHAYILMERIYSAPHPALCAMEGHLREGPHVSEVGRFGALLAAGERIQHNADLGYLVRTKGESEVETGISAGYGHLDSLLRS
jgi:glutathione synthase